MVPDGRAEDVDQFCRRLHPRLVGALRLHCGDPSLAEELAQEALARAWERWRTVAAMENRDGWVFRVAWNLANSHLRRRRLERHTASRRTVEEGGSSADAADAVAIRTAVRQLPTRERAAVVLRYFADLDVESTAEVMGCRPGTVKALTHQGIAHLRQWLGEDEEVFHDA